MRTRIAEPSEIVIWCASGLLAILLGIGGAFLLWFGLRGVAHDEITPLLVAGFGASLLLLGMASKQQLVRTIVALFAVTLVLSFVVGSPSFAHLV
jgi:hypothetical protein